MNDIVRLALDSIDQRAIRDGGDCHGEAEEGGHGIGPDEGLDRSIHCFAGLTSMFIPVELVLFSFLGYPLC